VCRYYAPASFTRAVVLTLAVSVTLPHVAIANGGDVPNARQQATSELDFYTTTAAVAAVATAVGDRIGVLLGDVLAAASRAHEASARSLHALARNWEQPREVASQGRLVQQDPLGPGPALRPQTQHVAIRESAAVAAENAPVGSHLVLTVTNLGLGVNDLNVVTFDGVAAPSYIPLGSDTELRTIVPFLAGDLPRTVAVVVWRNNVAGPAVPFEILPPAALPAGSARAILRRLLSLQIAATESYASWSCPPIHASYASRRPLPTAALRTAFLDSCEGLMAEQREARLLLETLEGLLDALATANPAGAELVGAYLVPSLPLLDAFERRTLPLISNPDADGLPSFVDNCPTIPNPDQADRDRSLRGDACEPSVNLNSLFTLLSTETILDPKPVVGGPAGTVTVIAQFANTGSTPMNPHFFEVVELSGGNVLLNSDTGPGGLGARVSLSPSTSSGGTVVFPGQPLPDAYRFLIGLRSRDAFQFRLDVVGAPDPR